MEKQAANSSKQIDFVPQQAVDDNTQCLIKTAVGQSKLQQLKRTASLYKTAYQSKYPNAHVQIVSNWVPRNDYWAPSEIVNDQAIANYISYVHVLCKVDDKALVPYMRMIMKYVTALCIHFKWGLNFAASKLLLPQATEAHQGVKNDPIYKRYSYKKAETLTDDDIAKVQSMTLWNYVGNTNNGFESRYYVFDLVKLQSTHL